MLFRSAAMRLGRNIQTENMTTRTAQEVFGNSKTQQRSVDDEAFNQMSDAIEAIRNAARVARSPVSAGFEVVVRTLERVGGFRADTATALARMLFNADRQQLDGIILQVAARMGPTRSHHFSQIINNYRNNVAQTSAAATAAQPPSNDKRKGAPPPRPPEP